jgi:hypothetical protein
MSRRFGFLHYLGCVIRTGRLAVATVVFDDVNITFDSSTRSADTPLPLRFGNASVFCCGEAGMTTILALAFVGRPMGNL